MNGKTLNMFLVFARKLFVWISGLAGRLKPSLSFHSSPWLIQSVLPSQGLLGGGVREAGRRDTGRAGGFLRGPVG